jgi:8-oxo-dGTP pyrophosphatase MutT (NUDIX family)
VLLTPQGRVLLFQYVWSDTGELHWVTPGGGMRPGETYEATARRELREETGLEVQELGPPVWHRRLEFTWNGFDRVVHERFFTVNVDEFGIGPELAAAHRADKILGHRWWSPDELERERPVVYPGELARLVRDLVDGRRAPRMLRIVT